MTRLTLCVVLLLACGDSDPSAPDSGAADANPSADGPTADAAPAVDPLDGIGVVELVSTLPTPNGGATPFTEGPVWNSTSATLLFSDIPNTTIQQLTLPNTVAPFRQPSGRANGLVFDGGGLLLAAEHEGRRISRTQADGVIVSVADRFEGLRFHSPNDLDVRSDGTIYFTDPPFGGNPAELDFNGLFRIATDGTVVDEVRYPQTARPNGVGLSPDETTLYMADTTGVVLSYDVAADGSLSNEQTFNDTLVDGADGLAIDSAGNIWITTADGIDVFAPSGAHWGTVTVPQRPANCTFGGADKKTLFITARDSLYRVEVVVAGL